MTHKHFLDPEGPFHNRLNMAMIVNHEAELDEYFKDFAVPVVNAESKYRDQICLYCGDTLFNEWSLTHGEAHCSRKTCGWPSRIYHYKIPAQDRMVTIGLQYHPSVMVVDEPEEAEKAEAQS